jgi:predicted dinucleotide-binding enzyme
MQEGSMNYATIGAGKEGQALAKAFARKQIEVAIASRRSPEALAPVAKAIGQTVIPESLQDAVKGGRRVVFLSSDDESAAGQVEAMVEQLGFAPVQLGKLAGGGLLVQARGKSWAQLIFQDFVKFK